MTTTMPESSLVPAAGTDTELVLAVSGGGRTQQEVRLRSERCSVGSDAHCTLRLKARDVAPLHCWIVRGRERTLVRCCSPDTRLNGRSFEEAVLAPGDVLSCGPIELQVVDLGGEFESGLARAEADADLAQRLSDLMQEREGFESSRRDAESELSRRVVEAEARWTEIRDAETELERRGEALEAREREWADRNATLERQIADFESECATRKSDESNDEDQAARWADAEAELNGRWEQLREAERQHSERCEQFEGQLRQEQSGRLAELQAREADLAEREVNMRRAVSDLATAHEQLDSERQEFERLRQEQPVAPVMAFEGQSGDEGDLQREQLGSEQAALEAARTELAAWEERLQHQEERIMQRRDELQAERERFYAECEQASAGRAAAVEIYAAPPAQEESVEASEPEACHLAPSGHGGEHDDEAAVIETYMSRLLGNSRSHAAAAPVHAAPTPPPAAAQPIEQPVDVAPTPQMPPRRERTEQSTPAERLTTLNNMRELANANARDAIDRSQVQQQFRAGMQRLMAAIAFAALGVWLGYMSNLAGSWMYTLGCLSGGFGIVAAIAQGAWLARRHLIKAWETTAQFVEQTWTKVQAKAASIKKEATLRPEPACETLAESVETTETDAPQIEAVANEVLSECEATQDVVETEPSACCQVECNEDGHSAES